MVNRRHIGRRGAVLIVLGVVWTLYGTALIAGLARAPYPDEAYVWHEQIPPSVRGLLWIVSGLVAAWWASSRPPHDRWGFATIIVMPTVVFGSFATSFVVWLFTPGESPGAGNTVLPALTWLAVCLLIGAIAGWGEPRPLPRSDPEQ